MGTFSFSVTRGNKTRGSASPTILSSKIYTSGAHTTSTTASFAEDASGDIVVASGEVVRGYADEAMRIAFGGDEATASTGHYIPAGGTIEVEVEDAGKVSVIDVA